MKRWILLPLLLMTLCLLAGCGDDSVQQTPYTMEIEYGDSGVEALMASYDWNWLVEEQTQTASAEAADPMVILSEIPFVNESKDKNLKLLFAEEPDTLEILVRSSEDGYEEAVPVEKPKAKVTVPETGVTCLYEVTATWEQTKRSDCWGSCTYYFRYLPEHATGEQSTEVTLYRILQMEPEGLFGVEFTNNLDQEKMTCTSLSDREAIVNYLRENLSTNFQPPAGENLETDYVLRLAASDGTQLVIGYGADGRDAWVLLGGEPYQAGVMDLYSLWKTLEAERVSTVELEPQEDQPEEAGQDAVLP